LQGLVNIYTNPNKIPGYVASGFLLSTLALSR